MGKFSSFWNRNYPGFCIGFGIANLVFATIYGMSTVADARDAVEEKKAKLEVDELPPKEMVKTIAPYFAPIIGFWVAGIGFIMIGNQANLDRGTAAAVLACDLIADHNRYVEKTKEIVGEKKERDIREAVAKEAYNDGVKNGQITVINNGDDGDYWMYDKLTKQVIRSTTQRVTDIKNELNERMLADPINGQVSVYDYCLAMGEKPIEFANEIGWVREKTGLIKLQNWTALKTVNGHHCIVIDHDVMPVNLY